MTSSVIVFSGVDGSGKSTQIKRLEESLKAKGFMVKVLWARGGYTPFFLGLKNFFRRVYPTAIPRPGNSAVRDKRFASSWLRRVWLTVAILDMGLLCAFWLRWLKLSGRIVLCDRYIEDTLLDFRRNFPQEQVGEWLLWRVIAKLSVRPDHRFLLLVAPEVSARRSLLKKEPFPDSQETLVWRYLQYGKMVGCGDWCVIDCSQPVEAVHARIRAALKL